jgi:hypothetical protein
MFLTSESAALQAAIEIVSRHSGVPAQDLRPESRLLHDLGVGGDDASELLGEIMDSYGLPEEGVPWEKYLPGEVPSTREILGALRDWITGRRDPLTEYLPITVRDLALSMLHRRWVFANTVGNEPGRGDSR